MCSLPVHVDILVEGDVDEAVARCLITLAGGIPSRVYGRRGKSDVDQRLAKYNAAARINPWLVLRDLNHDAPCPSDLISRLLPSPAPLMCFRIAVHEVESWLLADRENLATFLKAPISKIPLNPEAQNDPKECLINVARHSIRATIRADMIPRAGSGRTEGEAYTSRLIEFITAKRGGWRPRIATIRSRSLKSCIERLRTLIQGFSHAN